MTRGQLMTTHHLRGNLHTDPYKPTATVAETFSRGSYMANQSILSSGRLHLQLIYLQAGQVVTNLHFISGGTPLGTGTNQWFALYNKSRGKLAVTADDTSTAWGTNALKSLALTAAYTVPTSDIYYVGICVVASQVPTLQGIAQPAALTGLAPILCGHADTGLTDPASAPVTAAALTSTAGCIYAYVT